MSLAEKVVIKVILLGDSNVGKSSLINRYVHRYFSHNLKANIGVGFCSKFFELDNRRFTLQIWDTAGQERFHSLGAAFYRGADCCLIVYDVTSQESFDNVQMWRDTFLVQSNTIDPDNFPFALLGNKVDLEHHVNRSQAEKWCELHENIPFFETSAKENTNVDEVFKTIARMAFNKPEPPHKVYCSEHVELQDSIPKKSSSCTCK